MNGRMIDGRKNWITLQSVPKDRALRLLFRRTIYLKEFPEKAEIQVSADSRYKLYVNSQMVEAGPCKGDREIWFYDVLDLKSYLKTGENVIAVEVLGYPTQHGKGSFSIFRTGHTGLFLQGKVESCRAEIIDVSADSKWKVCMDPGFSIIPVYSAPLYDILDRNLGHWFLIQ